MLRRILPARPHIQSPHSIAFFGTALPALPHLRFLPFLPMSPSPFLLPLPPGVVLLVFRLFHLVWCSLYFVQVPFSLTRSRCSLFPLHCSSYLHLLVVSRCSWCVRVLVYFHDPLSFFGDTNVFVLLSCLFVHLLLLCPPVCAPFCFVYLSTFACHVYLFMLSLFVVVVYARIVIYCVRVVRCFASRCLCFDACLAYLIMFVPCLSMHLLG